MNLQVHRPSSTQDLDEFLAAELDSLQSNNLYRENKTHNPSLIDFSSNDYLGLASQNLCPADLYQGINIDTPESHSQNPGARSQEPGAQFGSTGSRLTTGTHPIHTELEQYISQWKQRQASIVFSSGYLANTGTISALLTTRDVVFSDKLNHSSIWDGIRLSGAKKFIYKHNDMDSLRSLLSRHRHKYTKAMIISDSVFSMEGDRAKIEDIVNLSKEYSCISYIDEAHANGVIGPKGSGLINELIGQGRIKADDIDIEMGTFSKAIGVEGAYITGSHNLVKYLKNKARTFVYSTASSPLILNKTLANLKKISNDDSLQKKLISNIDYFKQKLLEYKIDSFINEDTAIFTFAFDSIEQTMEASDKLLDQGLLVLAIRPPTVPSPRLRVCISAKHTKEAIDTLSQSLSTIR